VGKTLFGSLADAATGLLNRTPVPYAPSTGRAGLGSGLLRPAGQEAQMRAMGGSSTLFAIVDRIITGYSEVNWRLYRAAASGRDEDRVEVTSHAALDLWNAPNPFTTGPAFRESAQQHEELTGEQWWVIVRDPRFSIPLELWPVRPDRMEPIPDPADFLVGYLYRGPSGERIPLGVDDVLFLRRPNPIDPYRGMGAVQTILTDLDATKASAEWNRAFFLNSAEPGGIVEVDRRLDDEEFNQFRERWAEQHRGVNNAHRVAVLENGLKWIDRKYSMRDMQFTELRDVNREIIREAFGFPKPILGAVDDVNRANAEAADAVFARWLLKPRLSRTREILNTRLLPMYGATAQGLEFDYDNPVPEDREADANVLTARANAARTLIDAGLEPASVLAAVGLPDMAASPATGGDGTISPRELGDMIQSIYLGVGRVITWDEGRAILNRAGAGLSPGVPAPAALAPAPAAGLQVGPAPEPAAIEAAMRWVAVAHDDEDTCAPCRENDGQLYRNRAAAYEDYPGGAGYVHCVGAEYGNDCRCKVVKRRADS
jgi:HK97 family phage portal protein